MPKEKLNTEKKRTPEGFSLFRSLLILLCIPLVLFALLAFPPIQNMLVDWYAQKISDTIQADVSIGHVNMSVFKGLVASDMIVVDRASKDSLLKAESFYIGLKQNLLLLVNNELSLNEINVDGLEMNIITRLTEQDNSLSRAISRLSSSESDTSRASTLNFDLSKVQFSDFKLNITDENKAEEKVIYLEKGLVLIDEIDIEKQRLIIKRIDLDGPRVELFKDILKNPLASLPTVSNDSMEIKTPLSFAEIPFHVEIGQIELKAGSFSTINLAHSQDLVFEEFNANNFKFDQINISAEDFILVDSIGLEVIIHNMSSLDERGYSLKQMSGDVAITDRKIEINQFNLETENSKITDGIALKFRSFEDFNKFENRVIIDSYFDNSKISLKELTYYIPVLKRQSFFRNNIERNLKINGRLRGKLNNLSGRDVALNIDDKIYLRGKFDTRDITNPEFTLINLQLDELVSDMVSLRRIIPSFKPPDNYDRLGNIKFSGRFDGFYYDFVAFGDLETSLGKADLDMRLDVKDGRDNASYSGVMNLIDFNLSEWLGNDDLGFISLQSQVNDGRGLKLSNAYADLNAEIKAFTYKDYNYENIILTGQLDKNRFNGDFSIQNKDVDLNFKGNLQIDENAYATDFEADISKLDLTALNLVKDSLVVKGNISSNIQGSGFDDFTGEAEFGELELFYKDSLYVFDTLYINSSPDGLLNRNANIISETFSMSIDGQFDLKEIPNVFKWQLNKSYPFYASKLKIDPKLQINSKQDLNFKITVSDSRNYLDLLGLSGLKIKDLNAKGAIDTDDEYIFIESKLGSFTRKSDYGYALNFDLINRASTNKIKASIDSLGIYNRVFDPINLLVDMENDRTAFSIDTRNLADSIQVLNLRGSIEPAGTGIRIHFDNDKWEMFSTNWNFSGDNSIILKDKFIEIRNLAMTDGYRIIVLDDIQDHTGIDLSMRNFDFKLIDGLINYDKISFTGEGDVDLRVFKLFEKRSFDAKATIPQLMLNDISYGETNIDVHTSGNSVIGSLSIENDVHNIKAFGTYDTKTKLLNSSLKALGFQMKFFEDFILTDGISQTKGLANVYCDVNGPLSDIKINGDAIITNGGVKIDYLGNYIRYDNQRLKISESFIDLTGFEIIDTEGNVGVFTGGLRHDLLADFRVDLDATGDRFVGLNTGKNDNALYYGYGVGKMDIKFRGPFHSTDIKVNAVVSQGTTLNIPVSYYQEGYENSFITFIDSTTHQLTDDGFVAYKPEEFKIEGVDFEMNLELNPQANVNIIFNEQLNDIIRGSGEGNLRILLKRSGDFDVFGDYEIYQGEYLFTAYGFIAKPFIVKRGGRITWTGDPINAKLNIDAGYENLRAPLNIFLSEYMPSAPITVQDAAKEKTEVDLNLHLSGSLFEPVVSFDLAFPNLSGELRSYASSKVNTLQQNESEMNNQVVGLLIFNTFLPTTNTINSDIYTSENIFSTSYNTLSEFFSNQLSFLLSGFLQEALEENGFISGIDFEIGFSKNTNLYGLDSGTASTDLTPDEIEVTLKNRFLDDRWELNLGGNFIRETPTGGINNNYIIGDFVIAYYLTADKRLKLRAYGKYDVDEFDQQREQKYGFGISYRKEFGTLFELKEALKADTNQLFQSEGSN